MTAKLITISILALLLLTVIPMATTAAPTKSTISGPVYLIDSSGGYLGPRTGKITINVANDYFTTISLSKLEPNQQYVIGVTPGPEPSAAPDGIYTASTDSRGRISLSGSDLLGPLDVSVINGALSQGGVFVVYLQPP